MKTLKLSAGGGSALGGKKLIVCIALAAGVCIYGLPHHAWGITQSDIPAEKLSAGWQLTVGVKSNGMTDGTGYNNDGQSPVAAGWTDIVQISTQSFHTVGLKSDGTVVSTGADPTHGEININVPEWQGGDIIQVSAGRHHTAGVKADGSVVVAQNRSFGQNNVGGWSNIVQVTTGAVHTVGLKSDGTVVATPINNSSYNYGQVNINVPSWQGGDIVQIDGGQFHTVGLKSDGTVVSTVITKSAADEGQDIVNGPGWTNGDIVQVSASAWHTVALKSDGTVLAVGYNAYDQCNVENGANGFTDIVQVHAGDFHTVGLKSDGSVVAWGSSASGKLNTGVWDLSHTISGYAKNYGTGAVGTGVNGATVTLTPGPNVKPSLAQTPIVRTTNGSGYYEAKVSVVSDGDYEITTSYSDYNVTPYNFTVGNFIDSYAIDFNLHALSGYVKRYNPDEGMNGVDVTVTGTPSTINLTTQNDSSSNPGYYEAHVGYVGTNAYTIEASNPSQ